MECAQPYSRYLDYKVITEYISPCHAPVLGQLTYSMMQSIQGDFPEESAGLTLLLEQKCMCQNCFVLCNTVQMLLQVGTTSWFFFFYQISIRSLLSAKDRKLNLRIWVPFSVPYFALQIQWSGLKLSDPQKALRLAFCLQPPARRLTLTFLLKLNEDLPRNQWDQSETINQSETMWPMSLSYPGDVCAMSQRPLMAFWNF